MAPAAAAAGVACSGAALTVLAPGCLSRASAAAAGTVQHACTAPGVLLAVALLDGVLFASACCAGTCCAHTNAAAGTTTDAVAHWVRADMATAAAALADRTAGLLAMRPTGQSSSRLSMGGFQDVLAAVRDAAPAVLLALLSTAGVPAAGELPAFRLLPADCAVLLACARGEDGSRCEPMRDAGIFGDSAPSGDWLMDASRTSGCASGTLRAQSRYAPRCCRTYGRFKISDTLGLSLVSFANKLLTSPFRPLLKQSGSGVNSAAAIMR